MGLLTQLSLPPPRSLPGSGAPRRPPAATASPPGRAAKPKQAALTYNNVAALMNGINHLVQNWKNPTTLSLGESDAADLRGEHRALLEDLQAALREVKTDALAAMKAWKRVEGRLGQALSKATAAGMEGASVAATVRQLQYLWTTVFEPAGYAAAHSEARAAGGIEAPDLALMAPRLKKAAAELDAAKKLFEASTKLASGLGSVAKLSVPGDVAEIIEIAMLPGGIEEKIAQANKSNIAGTAAELVAKVTGATGTLLKLVGRVGAEVTLARQALLAAKPAAKEAKQQLEQLAKRFEKISKAAESVGKAASYAAVIADYVKLVSALAKGNYGDALDATKDLALDAAPLIFGPEVAGPLSVIVVTIQAELEVFRLAADFIRWCKDETVRQAATDFVEDCNRVAKGGAYDLVADWLILLDEDKAALHERTLRSAERHAAAVSKGISALSSHIAFNPRTIGGHPGVVASLGGPALQAMRITYGKDDGIPLVAQQVADLFAGANRMAKFVKATYTN